MPWHFMRNGADVGECQGPVKTNQKPYPLGESPHPIVDTTRKYCRHIKALLTPYFGAITVGVIRLRVVRFRV